MVLNDRLKRLAGGISARKAARAFARSLEPRVELSALERSQADEFAATVEAMFLMAAVDGEVSDQELSQLAASVATLADLEAAKNVELDRMLAELKVRLASEGWNARLDSVTRRIPTDDGKASAFRLAAGVAMVDDEVAPAEEAAIEAFAKAMNLSSDESQQILREVVEELFGTE